MLIRAFSSFSNSRNVINASKLVPINSKGDDHFLRRKLAILPQQCSSNTNMSFFNQMYLDFSQSSAVQGTQHLLETVHDITSLPWWATITLTTISLRLAVTLPLAAYQHYIFGKLTNLKPEMDEIIKELKKETDRAVIMYRLDEKTAKRSFHLSAKKQWNLLVQRENCHQGKASILIWGQVPLWVCMSVSLRNMAMMFPSETLEAQLLYLSLSNGGFGWIPNLTDVDHSFILPVTMALANLAIIQMQILNSVGTRSLLTRWMTNFFRVLCVVMVPIAAYAPADVALYWTVSSVYGLCQNLVLMSPRARRFFRIPLTPLENPRPYKHIADRLRGQLGMS